MPYMTCRIQSEEIITDVFAKTQMYFSIGNQAGYSNLLLGIVKVVYDQFSN